MPVFMRRWTLSNWVCFGEGVAGELFAGFVGGDFQGFVVQGAGDQHAGGGVAGLAGIDEAGADAFSHGVVEIDVGEEQISGFAAEFLGDALHRIGSGFGDDDTGAGRAGEGYHVDARVFGHFLTDRGAVAVDEVEDAGGDTCFVHDFGEDDGIQRGEFAGLEDHRAASGEGGGDFANDLVQRPIPGGDEADDANRLLHDEGGAAFFGEFEGFEGFYQGVEMALADEGLGLAGEADGSTHFLGTGLRDVLVALVVDGQAFFQEFQAFLLRGAGEGGKSLAGGDDGAIDVGGGPAGDFGENFLGGGVHHADFVWGCRVHPGAIDVEFQIVGHWLSYRHGSEKD
jgi:hypothetical protein